MGQNSATPRAQRLHREHGEKPQCALCLLGVRCVPAVRYHFHRSGCPQVMKPDVKMGQNSATPRAQRLHREHGERPRCALCLLGVRCVPAVRYHFHRSGCPQVMVTAGKMSTESNHDHPRHHFTRHPRLRRPAARGRAERRAGVAAPGHRTPCQDRARSLSGRPSGSGCGRPARQRARWRRESRG